MAPPRSVTQPKFGLYYEEFRVGALHTTAEHRLTREEISAFAKLTKDDNPLHVDRQLAQSAGFRDVLAHGALLQSLVLGLIAETGLMRGTTIALVAAHARFVNAAFAGDTLHARFRISKKRPTRAPDRGLLWRVVDLVNSEGTTVAEFRFTSLVRRLPSPALTGSTI